MALIGTYFSVSVLAGVIFKINALDNTYVDLMHQLQFLACIVIGGLIATIMGSTAVFSSKND